ncbi:MAG: PadR family transcriptional regulator [Lachnospiraceae bacterium]|nr:PadR family transcriptional regulator [Lachnospiraceae bacterium]
MIRGIILYYINIKPAHGYEIQRFLQVSGMEQWTRIQSGSIYYALTKLEKERLISVLREERTGSRVRKVYEITKEGKDALKEEMRTELAKPISDISSEKFLIRPMLGALPKEEVESIVRSHVQTLQEQKEFWVKWQSIKAEGSTDRLLCMSFEMTIDSLTNQIAWHEELLKHLDEYMKEGEQSKRMIASFDVTEESDNGRMSEQEQSLAYVMRLKEEILKNPGSAEQNLDRIIAELKKKH